MPGDGVGATENERGVLAEPAAIDPELDFGIEHREQCLEVAIARGGEKGIDHLPLPSKILVRLRGSPYAPRAASELLYGCFGAVEDVRDVRERDAK